MWLQVQFCYAVGAIDRKAAAFMVRFHLLGSDNTQKFMQIKSVIWSKKKGTTWNTMLPCDILAQMQVCI